jgi:arginyl-tRNA synthetase
VLAGLPADAPVGDKEQYIDALITRMRELVGADGYAAVQELALAAMIADIRDDLREFGVEFEEWFSERSLTRSGAVGAALARLAALGHSYEKEGALWLRSSDFGDSEDRVLVRANGQETYFAPDLAYHLNKFGRGFARLIDVWGADHHGYIPRMRAGLRALGADGDSFEVCLMQFVSLFRGGEKVAMGKRDGQFVTLRQLRAEVGNDACRVFYLMRSHDQPLDFDLELAKSRSNDNPVYYMQYAHARVASVMKQLAARGLQYDEAAALASLAQLEGAHEAAVLTAIARYPEVIAQAATNRTPHTLVHYLRELAQAFHTWYNAATFIVDDGATRNARLGLALGAQQVLRNGLALLGVTAPESM